MRKNNLVWTTAILFFLMVSCDKKQFFDEYQATGGHWKHEDVKKFSFEQKDTIGHYDMFINIRCNANYPYSNLYLIVKTFAPNNKTSVDTIQYTMAYPDGTLMGQGFTDTKESKLWFRENHRFKNPGVYTVEIEHAIRSADKTEGEASLEGIMDVGFRIEKRVSVN